MKINCPICNCLLKNEWENLPDEVQTDEVQNNSSLRIIKICDSDNHQLWFNYFSNKIKSIVLDIKNTTIRQRIIWDFTKNRVTYYELGPMLKTVHFKFWEPNLSDFPKLLSKIKTLLIFM